MKRFLAATVLAVLATQSPAGITSRQTRCPAERPLNQPARTNLSRDYGNLPLAFEPNVGQTDARVRFLSRGSGMTTFFTDTETVMVLSRNREQAVVRMKLAGTGQPKRAVGLDKLPGVSNYFLGNDPAKWRKDVPHYARVQYEGVYPGIDLVWYGSERRLEYDFVVAPGADPNQIQVAYEGVESLRVEAGGDLVLRTALGDVRQLRPRVYQDIGGKQVEVGARYSMVARNRVSFVLARYDRKRELRIDPVVLGYSTYLGGVAPDWGNAIAVDGAGSVYVTGSTQSTDFPTQSAYQATIYHWGQWDVFVTKLTPAGNTLIYSTYLGGRDTDYGYGIAVDAAGSAYVMGHTKSIDFPTQLAYQATFRGGAYDAFVTKLTAAGNALGYSTYLGGSGDEQGSGIAVDGTGSAYVTGFTGSTNFPTQSPYQATRQGLKDVFVTKLTTAGNALGYSTYLGGSGDEQGSGIAVDGTGSAYVTGWTGSANFPTQSPYQATKQGTKDAFVTKLTTAGNALVYSTHLGGSGDEWGYGIAVDGAGSAYVTGYTSSIIFPTMSPYQAKNQGNIDAFVTKLTPIGNALIYSTYLGGSGLDMGVGIAVDGTGSAYVTGSTQSADFPTQSPYQATYGENADAFATKLAPAGNALVYSTYLGGSASDTGYGIAVDAAASAYVTGTTASANFPTQSPYQAAFRGLYDAFVTKIQLDQVATGPQFTLAGVANAANYVAGKVSPGEIIVIFGKDFGPAALAGLQLANGKVATETGETRVLFDDVAAPMVYAVNGQISCVVPYEVAGKATTQIAVEYKKVKGAAVAVPVVEAVPGLFSINSSGTGPGAFLNQDNSVNTAANPLDRGKIAIFYGTGEGQTSPGGVSGLPATTTFPAPLLTVTVTIGGKSAKVHYAGAAPYMVAGVIQINAEVPTDIPAGNAEVIIKVGNNASQAGITLAVK
jgi:uncharacterized protein (TIGR03437 family)